MRRLLMVFAAMAVMAAMMVVIAMPALAAKPPWAQPDPAADKPPYGWGANEGLCDEFSEPVPGCGFAKGKTTK